jgi:DNA repair ATPase RecN
MSRVSPKNRKASVEAELGAIDALLTEMTRRRKAGDISDQPLAEAETRLRNLRRCIRRYNRLNEQAAQAPSPRRKSGAGNAR